MTELLEFVNLLLDCGRVGVIVFTDDLLGGWWGGRGEGGGGGDEKEERYIM